jgi:hypothetical protein
MHGGGPRPKYTTTIHLIGAIKRNSASAAQPSCRLRYLNTLRTLSFPKRFHMVGYVS